MADSFRPPEGMSGEGPWLPETFVAPAGLELSSGHHLRPIRASDIELDYPAVMSSQPRLWRLFGQYWGWPPADMTIAQDLADLERHENEMARNASFNYAIFDLGETELLGCVYIDPPQEPSTDAEVAWWVVDGMVGTDLERALRDQIPGWLAGKWHLTRPRIATPPD